MKRKRGAAWRGAAAAATVSPMRPDLHADFTRRLVAGLAGDRRVLGVVALGSSSGEPPPPDEWSDHDLFLVVAPGAQEPFRQDLGWLPDASELVHWYRETEHGLKALYRSGHLVELAVFAPEELAVARVNRMRVVLDRGGVAERMEAVRAASGEAARREAPGDDWLMGQLLTALLVGAGRWRRGERLSGGRMVKGAALEPLLRLLGRHLPAPGEGRLDGLDPFRRFEAVLPALGAEIDEALREEPPEAARRLLGLAVRELGGRLPRFPHAGAAAVGAALGQR